MPNPPVDYGRQAAVGGIDPSGSVASMAPVYTWGLFGSRGKGVFWFPGCKPESYRGNEGGGPAPRYSRPIPYRFTVES